MPFGAGRLDGSPVLVLAPHPDDEIFGCGGVLAQAVDAGAEVRVVVLTDGAAQGDAATRQAESAEAARRLGLPVPEHWNLGDRTLAPGDPRLAARIRALLEEVRPHVVLVPSPAEVHPDHRALALLVYRLLQQAEPGTALHQALQATRLASYEITTVLRPNLLVDVTDEWDRVLVAAKAFTSQLRQLPYIEVLQAMATARRLTLPSSVRHAEAYWVTDLRFVRTHSAHEWASHQGPAAELETVSEAAPLDVVVRTRNRPQLLIQALASLESQRHLPARVIVVNDGGEPVDRCCARLAALVPLEIVDHAEVRGRAGAAQAGLERATASHVVFLDDDDLFLADHLLVLGRAVASGTLAPFTDAVQGIWHRAPSGELEQVARHRTFRGGFDLARLRLINHIPLPTIAIPRQLALEVGGFDRALELYEDWDLLLRMARRTPFTHLPGVTCEYRVIAEAESITATQAPGSEGQLAALQEIWRRHGLLEDPQQAAEAVLSLVTERDSMAELARQLDEQLLEARGALDGARTELTRLRHAGEELARAEQQVASAREHAARLETELEGRDAVERALRAEIERLQSLLETIFASRTWRLHQLLERLRGHGTICHDSGDSGDASDAGVRPGDDGSRGPV